MGRGSLIGEGGGGAGWWGIAEMLLGGVRSRSMGKAAGRKTQGFLRDGAATQRDEVRRRCPGRRT